MKNIIKHAQFFECNFKNCEIKLQNLNYVNKLIENNIFGGRIETNIRIAILKFIETNKENCSSKFINTKIKFYYLIGDFKSALNLIEKFKNKNKEIYVLDIVVKLIKNNANFDDIRCINLQNLKNCNNFKYFQLLKFKLAVRDNKMTYELTKELFDYFKFIHDSNFVNIVKIYLALHLNLFEKQIKIFIKELISSKYSFNLEFLCFLYLNYGALYFDEKEVKYLNLLFRYLNGEKLSRDNQISVFRYFKKFECDYELIYGLLNLKNLSKKYDEFLYYIYKRDIFKIYLDNLQLKNQGEITNQHYFLNLLKSKLLIKSDDGILKFILDKISINKDSKNTNMKIDYEIREVLSILPLCSLKDALLNENEEAEKYKKLLIEILN